MIVLIISTKIQEREEINHKNNGKAITQKKVQVKVFPEINAIRYSNVPQLSSRPFRKNKKI